MNFETFIGSFKADDSSWQESPALFERITNAKNIINGNHSNQRSVKAPEYLTDFGLRHSENPYLFMKLYCERLNKELPITEEVQVELQSLDINKLTEWIDAIVLTTGNYQVCYVCVKNRKVEIIQYCTNTELVKLATLCGASNDAELAITFFKAALKKSSNIEDKKLILHRLDVVYLKRAKKIDDFYKYSQKLINSILTSNDSEEVTALLDNLIALQLILPKQNHLNNIALARLLLQNAKYILRDAINKIPDFNLKLSELVRYNSQISINQVQLELELKHYDLAEEIMLKNFDLVKKYNNEYLSEVLSSLGYIYYQEGNYKASIDYASKAIISHSQIGGISGMNEAKKLLIASLYKLNRIAEANEVFNTFKTDPLGIDYNYAKYRTQSK